MPRTQSVIVLRRRMTEGKWHACWNDNHRIWAAGDSIDEAIGNLIRTNQDHTGIRIDIREGEIL